MKKDIDYLDKISDKKSFLYKFAQFLLPPFYKLLYRVKIKRKGSFPDGRYIMCANHCTLKDPIFLGMTQKRQIYFMAKKELFKNKFIGGILLKLGAFPVARQRVSMNSIAYAEALLEKDKVLGLFIEGTRSKDGNLLPPKRGAVRLAFKTNSPIVPVSISQRDGKPMKLFHKVTINVGKPVSVEDLGITDGNPKEMQNATVALMDKIKQLRAEDVEIK